MKEWRDKRAKISPVTKVRKRAMRPFSMRAHLECVPGRTTVISWPRPKPTSCVSSPRITSGKGLTLLSVRPGMKPMTPPSASLNHLTAACQRVGARRRFDIRCLDPAVAARDHSGSVNRKRRVRGPPGSDVTGQDRFEPGLRHRLDAVLRLDAIEGRTLRIDEERAKARRSPIEHDAARRMSGSLHAMRPCARPRSLEERCGSITARNFP